MGNASTGVITGTVAGLMAIAFGLSMTGRLTYCEHCGAESTRSAWEFYGLRLGSRERVSETGYSKLYDRYISRDKEHKWQQYSSSRTGLLNSGVSCADLPMIVLLSTYRLAGVEKLGDRRRIRSVVAAFDLERPYDHKAEDAKLEAVRTLGAAKTRAEADAWWRKHGAEFERASRHSLPHPQSPIPNP